MMINYEQYYKNKKSYKKRCKKKEDSGLSSIADIDNPPNININLLI